MDGLEIPLRLLRLKHVHSHCVRVCVREVTTADNKHILSLYTISILFPVQKTVVPRDAAWRLIFSTSWFSPDGGIGEQVSQPGKQVLGCCISCCNCSHYSQHYLAGSELFCKDGPHQLRPGPGAISRLHQLEFTIRWQSTNAFLRCELHGGSGSLHQRTFWCLNATHDSQRTSRKYPIT